LNATRIDRAACAVTGIRLKQGLARKSKWATTRFIARPREDCSMNGLANSVGRFLLSEALHEAAAPGYADITLNW
jgi:hypothetical protein